MNKKNILKIILEHEENSHVDLRRFIVQKNKGLAHYKTQDEVVFLFFELNEKQKVISKKDQRCAYQGIIPYNSRSQIDGWEEVTDLDETNNNINHAKAFIENVLMIGASKTRNIMGDYISSEKYFQHNYDNKIGDGLNELLGSVDRMLTYGSDLQYDKNLELIGQGNFVFSISQQYWLNPKTNQKETWEYWDLFRLEKGKLVEHWDIIKQIK